MEGHRREAKAGSVAASQATQNDCAGHREGRPIHFVEDSVLKWRVLAGRQVDERSSKRFSWLDQWPSAGRAASIASSILSRMAE